MDINSILLCSLQEFQIECQAITGLFTPILYLILTVWGDLVGAQFSQLGKY
jgi:hypothetical protein